MAEIVLKPASKDEAELLVNIHSECFTTYWNAESFTDFFSISGTLVLVALEGAEPVGMVVHRVQHEQADIITLCVKPGFRRRGVAALLLAAALEKAAAQGAIRMFLDVEDNNAAAIALYEKYGFIPLRTRKQYYRQKDGSFTDALVMARKLA